MVRLYDWMMTRLGCCGCGCGIVIGIGSIASAGGGYLTWQVVT